MIDMFAAFFCALPVGMGVGGAGLYVIFLSVCRNIAQPQAQGANYLFFLFSAVAGTAVNLKNRMIEGKKVRFWLLCALPGALAGALLAFVVPANFLRTAFAVLMIVFGFFGMLRK